MVTFGIIIKEARERKGLSHIELSHKTEISESQIQRIEKYPLTAPKKHNVLKLAHALNLDFEEIMEIAQGERILAWCKDEHIKPEYLMKILKKSPSEIEYVW